MLIKTNAIRFFVLGFVFCWPILSALSAQNTGVIVGTVKDRATQEPLIGATVVVEGANLGTNTDADGKFRIAGIPPKSWNLRASYLGYVTQTRYNVVVTTGNANFVNFELETDNQTLGEVTVSENKSVRIASLETPLSVQSLSVEEIKSNPGGNFDISRVVQALPGVSGTAGGGSGFRNDLVIRGGGPNENVYYLDGVEIPILNHFATQGSAGGPAGILNVSFIEDVTLSSSAFNARYDNALSSVLQFRQRDGNPDRFQGNFRLSGTESAFTAEGPLGKRNGRTTFLASARRSYLQFLFEVLDLPIRPNYWDFQYKITHKIDAKTTFTSIGIGAIDEFTFALPKDASPENLYVLSSNPSINQWNYTQGFALKRLVENGYWNLTLSRNMFDNKLDQFEDNYDLKQTDETKRILGLNSQEIENKLRFDYNQFLGNWKFSAGAMAQYVKYNIQVFNRLRPEVRDSIGNLIQPALSVNFNSAIDFFKYGLFVQVNRSFLNERLGLSFGLRTDGNTFTNTGNDLLRTLSPRLNLSYALSPQWKANASLGRYYKIPIYTILGYQDERGFVNRSMPYTRADHYVAGLEFVPGPSLRFTAEGFYKFYNDYPVSARDGISLANQGGGFGVIGNEAVVGSGTGEASGFELFAQQKLNNKLYFTASYTLFWSRFSGRDGQLIPSAWDSRHLLSLVVGRKFRRNWEIGLKYRFQGGVPFTPFDEAASLRNFTVVGQGILDYSRLNTQRLQSFNQFDFRVDKKWNFKRTTLDLFFDVQNALVQTSPQYPQFTLKRNETNTGFATTDGKPLQSDGANGIPIILGADDPAVLPTIGFIFEF